MNKKERECRICGKKFTPMQKSETYFFKEAKEEWDLPEDPREVICPSCGLKLATGMVSGLLDVLTRKIREKDYQR